VLVAVYLLHSLFAGARAPANPWGGATLEWACSSPPPVSNFERPPIAGDPYDFSGLRYEPQLAGYVRQGRPGAEGETGP
jgi:cytochrome c oxidase subunit 1